MADFFEAIDEPDCEHKKDCTSKGAKCKRCKHNRNRNPFPSPSIPPYPSPRPWYPINPYNPYRPYHHHLPTWFIRG